MSASSTELEVRPLTDEGALVGVAQVELPEEEVGAWAAKHRPRLDTLLTRHGALLFRTQVRSAAGFEAFIQGSSSTPWTGNPNLFSPRHQVHGSVYTSTDGWFQQKGAVESGPIAQHCEFSHSPFRRWPMKLYFFCEVAPKEGGETPLADPRRVLERISPRTRERFLEHGLRYRRVFYEGEVAWQQVFQTSQPAEVEARCRTLGVECHWQEGHRHLTLSWRLHVMAEHPVAKQWAWFNQAHVVAFDAIPAHVREHFLAKHGYEGRPLDCTFGDGSPIPGEVLAEVSQAYEAEQVRFRWEQGDILMIDNMLVSHGRASFSGPRRVLAGMAEEASSETARTR